MTDAKRKSVTSRIRTLAAVARARQEVRAGLHSHPPGDDLVAVTVGCSELSLLVTPHYGSR